MFNVWIIQVSWGWEEFEGEPSHLGCQMWYNAECFYSIIFFKVIATAETKDLNVSAGLESMIATFYICVERNVSMRDFRDV